MKWEYIGTGLGLIGIGITLMLALPPQWLPKMSQPFVYAGILGGILFVVIGCALSSMGVFPVLEHRIGPIFLMVAGVFLFSSGVYWYHIQGKTQTGEEGNVAPVYPPFYSAHDKENLANLCTELIGFLRENGGDGGGTGAFKKASTLGNDWGAMRDSKILDKDLAEAHSAVKSLWDGLYGDGGILRRYEAYHNELDQFLPPSQGYPGQIRGLETAINEFGLSISAVEAEKDVTTRQRLFMALEPSHEKYTLVIQQFQKHLFEATQRVEVFRRSLHA